MSSQGYQTLLQQILALCRRTEPLRDASLPLILRRHVSTSSASLAASKPQGRGGVPANETRNAGSSGANNQPSDTFSRIKSVLFPVTTPNAASQSTTQAPNLTNASRLGGRATGMAASTSGRQSMSPDQSPGQLSSKGQAMVGNLFKAAIFMVTLPMAGRLRTLHAWGTVHGAWCMALAGDAHG